MVIRDEQPAPTGARAQHAKISLGYMPNLNRLGPLVPIEDSLRVYKPPFGSDLLFLYKYFAAS